MTGFWRRLAALLSLSAGLALAAPALAHTPDISTGKIAPQANRLYMVDVGFLATDLERMFQETMDERAGVDLSPPGVLEEEIGKFVAKRVAMRDETGRACLAKVEKAGEDPTNQDSALVAVRFDCSGTSGKVFYDATKLLAAQGSKGKHLVTLLGENAGETMLYPQNPPLDLSQPMETTAQLMKKFFEAGVEHIVTGYDHLCFLFALILWATRIWPVVKIVTAFTISHSITLSLAALNIFTLPSALTEFLIAASIVFVAVENYFSRDVDNRWRNTFLFGFIHGFGFASALTEMGVPQGGVVPALAAFNIGVEAGQIAIVVAVMPILFFVDGQTGGKRSEKLVYAVSAIIALAGAYWMVDRLPSLAQMFKGGK
ncbi:HupE/UreJ family protein [Methylocystis sp. JAN1]|uniref:HupE/UreJ family protein n=1 Tax=Methylocystis sp. JAN1 TaxID=3397211 RepID=UPI003FA222CC